jgi:small-conductance mechanosensitive channel
MNLLNISQEWLRSIFSVTWFTIGTTPISFTRVLGLVLILILIAWAAYAIERLIIRLAKASNSEQFAESTVYAFSRISRYVVWFIGSILGLNFIGFDMTSLALVGGALGVGIGFGLQNIFSNLVSGIIILIERTLKVDDFVDLQSGVMGRVSEINMRYTRITTNDKVDIFVPNSEFINGRVINWTYGELLRRMHIPFGVAYSANKEVVKQAALAAAKNVNFTIEDTEHHTDVWLVKFGESSFDFELVVWVDIEGARAPAMAQAKYLWALETELSKAGIEIPYPQRDIRFRGKPFEINLINK